MEIPRIVSNNDALRQRRQLEHEMRVAATVARARQHWSQNWDRESVPLNGKATTATGAATQISMTAPHTMAPVSAIYQPNNYDGYWSTPSIGGLRRDKIVLYSHAAAMAIHIALLITTIVVAAASDADPNLSLWRQRFVLGGF